MNFRTLFPATASRRGGRTARAPRRTVTATVLASALLLAIAVPALADPSPPTPSSAWAEAAADRVQGWLRQILTDGPPADSDRPERPDTASGTVGPISDPDGFAPSTTRPPTDPAARDQN